MLNLEEFPSMISVVYPSFAPPVVHLSVGSLLRLMGDRLHLPFQVRVVLGLITCGILSMLISVPSVGGA